ncbi:MAG: thiol reductant ABC exporter subunit CydC [Actinobacteria bacterium]|nr:thiol reductant ABC exporter subunit CydC [Actinomycetota bacterium]
MKRIIPYFLSGAAYVSGIGLTLSSAWLITMASFHPPLLTLSIAIVGVRFFGIARSVSRYTERLTSHKSIFDRLTALRVRLFEKITARPIELIRDLGSGTLVKRLVDDVERAQEYELRITLPHAAAAISLCTGAGLGAWIQPESLFVTVPVILLLLVAIPRIVLRKCENIARRIESHESEYALLIQQAGQGFLEAQLYGYLEERISRVADIENQIMCEEKRLADLSLFFQFLFVAVMGFTLLSLAYMVEKLSPEIPAVQVTMLIFLPLILFEAIIALYPNLFGAGKLLLAKSEIAAIESREVSAPPHLQEVSSPISALAARSVQVKWQPGDHFMQPVSFTLNRGESLIIRGRSGSGKSTLGMALLGLLDYDGEILLDGVDLRSVANLSDHIAGGLQSGHIFNTSLRENLKIAAPMATDEELMQVLAIVEMDALVKEMADGLDNLLGTFGRALSGGEAKRLNLARALLSRAQILILDEPTEHLDEGLASRLEERILNSGRTLIVITHSGWKNGSATLVLER